VLLAPSLDAVGEMYQRQKSILNTAFVQKAESSLHHRVEASILAPAHPTDEGQRAAQGALDEGETSLPTGFLAYNCLSRPSDRSELQVYQRHRLGENGTQSQQ
jgi:hypothetical protein